MGGAVSQEIPAIIDRETFIGRFSDERLFNKLQVNEVVTREALLKALEDDGFHILRESPCELTLEGQGGPVTSLCGLRDGRLAMGLEDNTVRIWNGDRQEMTLDGNAFLDDEEEGMMWGRNRHRFGILRLLQLHDGRLATGSVDCTKVWNIAEEDCVDFNIDHGSVSTLLQLRDGTLLTGSLDLDVKLWNPAAGDVTMSVDEESRLWAISAIELHDGRVAFITGMEGDKIQLWSMANRVCERVIALQDGSHVRVIELQGGTCDQALPNDHEVVGMVQIDADRIANGDGHGIRISRISTGKTEYLLSGHIGAIVELVLLSSGMLLSRAVDNIVKIWNPNTGIIHRTLVGHSANITCVLELSDKKLATGSKDGTVKIWAAEEPTSAQGSAGEGST